jgi:D-cysteine desulfhydrase
VLVTDILPPSAARLSRLANRTSQLLRSHAPAIGEASFSPEDFTIIREYVGPAYGAPTEEARRARDLIRHAEGIELETTYTAKCLAAVLDRGTTGGPILFWNTYSSIDPADHLGRLPDPSALPKPFHRFFVDEPIDA